jgi:hypothetical protein
VRRSSGSGEDPEDIVWGLAHTAERRERLLAEGRRLSHVGFAASIWTWWPFKPDPPDEIETRLLVLRPRAFAGARFEEVDRLDLLVPDRTLMLTTPELYERQQLSVSAFLANRGSSSHRSYYEPTCGRTALCNQEHPVGYDLALDAPWSEVDPSQGHVSDSNASSGDDDVRSPTERSFLGGVTAIFAAVGHRRCA